MQGTLWDGEQESVRYAQLFSRAVDVELRLNDIPIKTATADRMVTSGIPVRQFTVLGQNVLSVICGDRRAAPTRGGWSDIGKVTARVADFAEGEQLEETAGIERAVLRPAFTAESANPMVQSAPFESRFGADWAWYQAQIIDPAAARSALDQFFTSIHAAYAQRNMEPLVNLFEPAIRDRVRAYPALSIEGQIRMTRGRFARANPEHWAVEPLDLETAEYRTAAGGRLIQALDGQCKPLILSVPLPGKEEGDDPWEIEFTNLVGVWNGRLAVLV